MHGGSLLFLPASIGLLEHGTSSERVEHFSAPDEPGFPGLFRGVAHVGVSLRTVVPLCPSFKVHP
jgi:hypothetical protein